MAVQALRLSSRLLRLVSLVHAQLPAHFHAIYVRNQDDWADMCVNFAFTADADCWLPTPTYLKRASLLLGLKPGSTIFLAGPSHTKMGPWQAMGYHVVTMSTALPWWPISYSTVGAHDIALVEAAISTQGTTFVGHRLSSFAFLVAEQRALKTLPSWFVDAPLSDACQGSRFLCPTLRSLWLDGCRNTEGDLRHCWRQEIGQQVISNIFKPLRTTKSCGILINFV